MIIHCKHRIFYKRIQSFPVEAGALAYADPFDNSCVGHWPLVDVSTGVGFVDDGGHVCGKVFTSFEDNNRFVDREVDAQMQ